MFQIFLDDCFVPHEHGKTPLLSHYLKLLMQ